MSCKSLFPIAAVGACVAVGLVPPIAGAETFVAGYTEEDMPDWSPGDGECNANPIPPPVVCTLRAAIEEANAWPGTDVIEVPAATFVLELGWLGISESLQINGEGMYDTIVDGNQQDRVFFITGDSTVVDMNDLAVQNGFSDYGGGIFVSQGRLNLSGCRVADNTAHDGAGGGIYVESGRLEVDWSIITNNSATASIIPMFMENGGGIIGHSSDIWLWQSTIVGNEAASFGGGISALNSYLYLENCAVSVNHALYGGGIDAQQLDLWRSTVFKDRADLIGGGIYLEPRGPSEWTSSTISGNEAGDHGGGVYTTCSYAVEGWVDLNNVTISDNTADSDEDEVGDGGGFYNMNSTDCGLSPVTIVNLGNTILAGNHDIVGGLPHQDCSGPFVSLRHNLIGDGSGCSSDFPPGLPNANDDWAGWFLGPINPMLSPLDDYSGFTPVHAPEYGSPAIDHAHPGSGPGWSCESTDQHGWARVDGDGDMVAVGDIGAIEYRDCNNNNVHDGLDINNGTSRDCNYDGVPDECVVICTLDCECFDGDPCTADSCGDVTPGVCHYVPALYGDLDFNTAVNVFDIFCIRDAIAGDYHCGHWWELDINPCTPNGVLNVFDMIAIRDVIAGYPPCCNP